MDIKKFIKEDMGIRVNILDGGGIELNLKDAADILGVKQSTQNKIDYYNFVKKINKYLTEVFKYESLLKKVSESNTKNINYSDFCENTWISESLFYYCCIRANTEKAIRFQIWVCEDVLPSIRKNNYYINEKEIDNEQLNKLQKEIEVLKKQKNMLHEIVYDVSDATFMSFTEASFKLFKKDAKYLKEVLIKEKILGEDGKQVLVKEADFKMNDGTLKKMRLFTEVSIEKPRPEDDIHYNKITNFGYMYLKKYFNSRGMSDFSFNKEVDNND